MNKIKLLALAIGTGLIMHASLGVAAGKGSGRSTTLYKWVDENGETHYGEVVPPEYADRDQTLINAKPLQAKKKIGKSADEEVEKTPEELAALEQRRKDRALLNTYSNEKEIDLARGRNLQQVEARINSIQLQSKSVNGSLQGYLQEQANLKKAGKPLPESLKTDIADGQKRISDLQNELTEAKEKAAAVRADFDADKARYHLLTTPTPK